MTRVADLSGRYPGAGPAVDVKDRTLYARTAPWAELIEQLGEQDAEMIYAGIVADFWQDIAPDIAEEHGYSREVLSEGRSGGWLVPKGSGIDFLEVVGFETTVSEALGMEDVAGDDDALIAKYTADPEHDPEPLQAIADRDRFLRFADAIAGAMQGAREMFAQRMREHLDSQAQENSGPLLIRVTLRDRDGVDVETVELPPDEAGRFAGAYVVTHGSDPDVRNGVAGDGVDWAGSPGSIDFAPVGDWRYQLKAALGTLSYLMPGLSVEHHDDGTATILNPASGNAVTVLADGTLTGADIESEATA